MRTRLPFFVILDKQRIQVYLTFLTLLIPYKNNHEQILYWPPIWEYCIDVNKLNWGSNQSIITIAVYKLYIPHQRVKMTGWNKPIVHLLNQEAHVCCTLNLNKKHPTTVVLLICCIFQAVSKNEWFYIFYKNITSSSFKINLRNRVILFLCYFCNGAQFSGKCTSSLHFQGSINIYIYIIKIT